VGLSVKQLSFNRSMYSALLCTQAVGIVFLAQTSKVFIGLECPIRAVIGIQCPGCGSSRCIRAIGNGDLMAGMRYNPFLTLSLLGLALFGFLGVSSPVKASNLTNFFRNHQRILAALLVIATVIFTGVRNLASTTFFEDLKPIYLLIFNLYLK